MVGADVPGSPRARCVRAGAPGTQRKNRKRQERRARGYREGHRISAGQAGEDEDLTHVIRYKDVLKWLKIHRRTLDYYIQRGYLKRVYGGGETRHRRFAGQLPQVHRKAVGKMRGGDEG